MIDRWIPRRALFIYAHPDDVDFSAAATAAKWAQAGCEVVYLILTDGSAGSHETGMTKEKLTEIRRKEQQAAADVTGVAKCIFLDQPDGLLESTLTLRKEVVRVIREHKPEAVVCGDPRPYFSGNTYINHPDHRAAARLAVEAVFPAAEMNLLYPDLVAEGLEGHKVNIVYVSTREDPNCYIDVTDTVELKIEALRQHKSQMGDWDPDPRIRARLAEIGKQAGCSYAESFRRMTLGPTEGERR
ncbi:MAG: PIG-L deacetylase family protein [Chloroflexota bacterium]